MQEGLVLLLVLAAAAGWFIARRDYQKRLDKLQRPQDLTHQYYEGLNYLLNEQQDQAIDVFVRMLEVNSETVEIHLALGNLYRRRGEVDRAIRLHQNLIARPTLEPQQREKALLELGEDYLKAGLLDRAERLFSELAPSKAFAEPSLRSLLEVYQQEKDWDQAIETARLYEKRTGKRAGKLIAQFYCELAEQALAAGDRARAGRLLRRALSSDSGCVRASVLQGGLEMEKSNYKAAIRAFTHIEDQDADFLPEVLEPLAECYHQLGNDKRLVQYLGDIFKRYGGARPAVLLSKELEQQGEPKQAVDFVADHVRRQPSILGLHRLIELGLASDHERSREVLATVREMISNLVASRPGYRCTHCGFESKRLFWQCPSCKRWSSIKPFSALPVE